MTREELFNAFRQVASEEFAHIPNEEDIEYEFSERFNKKMDKLFKKIERNCTYPTVSLSKRILTIAAAILIIFAGLMSVSAIREPIVNFVLEFFEEHIDFGFSGDISQEIEYEYGFSKIPEGFELTVKNKEGGTVYTEYTNINTGDIIILTQSITDSDDISIDKEHGAITKEFIYGMEVYIYEHNSDDYINAIMTKENYSVMVVYYGDIEKEEFIDLVKSIN